LSFVANAIKSDTLAATSAIGLAGVNRNVLDKRRLNRGCFAIEQRLYGELDWHLVNQKTAEADAIQAIKAVLKVALNELLRCCATFA